MIVTSYESLKNRHYRAATENDTTCAECENGGEYGFEGENVCICSYYREPINVCDFGTCDEAKTKEK